MANTTVKSRATIQITGLDADWTWDTDGGFNTFHGVRVSSIQFLPSAASDVMIVHDGGVDGADIFNSGPTVGTSPLYKNFDPPVLLRPVIDISDCTLDSAGDAKVIIDYV